LIAISPRLIAPEARAAVAAFRDASTDIELMLLRSGSGRELVEGFGWRDDIQTAAAIDADDCVPTLLGGEFVDAPVQR
jgi:2-phosphosulfolactate phosphatase